MREVEEFLAALSSANRLNQQLETSYRLVQRTANHVLAGHPTCHEFDANTVSAWAQSSRIVQLYSWTALSVVATIRRTYCNGEALQLPNCSGPHCVGHNGSIVKVNEAHNAIAVLCKQHTNQTLRTDCKTSKKEKEE